MATALLPDAKAEATILWPPDIRANSLEKTLMLGKIEGRRRRQLDGIIDSMDLSLGKLWAMVKDGETWRATVRGVTKSWTRLSDSTPTPAWCVSNTVQCLPSEGTL